jgi:hypothetical protein
LPFAPRVCARVLATGLFIDKPQLEYDMHWVNAGIRARATFGLRARQRLRRGLVLAIGTFIWACSADSVVTPESTGVQDEGAGASDDLEAPGINAAITSTSFRNMPSGMTPVAEIGFSGSSLKSSAIRGVWDGPWYGSSYFTLPVSDQYAPGAPYTSRTRWPAGLTAGNSPLSFGGWDRRGGYSYHGRYKKLYISLWLKIPSKDYENQNFGTKLFYLGHGNTYRTNHDFLYLQGSANGTTIQSNMKLGMAVSRADERISPGSLTYIQNMGTGAKFTAGSWHQVELYLDVGTVDKANGTVRIWVDGTKVTDYTSRIKFLDSRYSFTQGFYDFLWTPVWGGSGGKKSRSDAILIDHVFIAGIK